MKVEARELSGKKVKKIREAGKIPAAMFGPKFPSVSIVIDRKEFRDKFQEAGFSNLFDVETAEGKEKVLVKEVQQHPVTDEFLHVSLYVTDKNTEIMAEVPVHLEGIAPAEDLGFGFVVHALNTFTIRCLPANLPSEFVVNIEGLTEVGQSISVSDVVLPEGVELDSSMDPTTAVTYIAAAQKIEDLEAEDAAAAEAAEDEEGTEDAGEEAEENEE